MTSPEVQMVTLAVALACVASSVVGLVFNVSYALNRRGRPSIRRLKLIYSLVQAGVSAMYVLYRAGLAPMPDGGVLLSFGIAALVITMTAGAIANDSR